MDREQLIKAKRSRAFRRIWMPIIRTLLSSASDIVGDWVFYFRVAGSDYAPDLAPWLMGFSIVSSVLGFCTVLSLVMDNLPLCVNMHNIHKTRFQKIVQTLVLSEMFLEDIPQMVLTYVVLERRVGDLNGVAIFNITTSAFNFVYNGLDLLVPLDEEHYDQLTEDVEINEGLEDNLKAN